MKTLAEFKEEVNKRVVRNMNCIMRESGLNANMFCEYCKKQYGIDINTGNLWKMLKGEIKMDIVLADLFCEWSNINLNSLIWEDKSVSEYIVDRSCVSKKIILLY